MDDNKDFTYNRDEYNKMIEKYGKYQKAEIEINEEGEGTAPMQEYQESHRKSSSHRRHSNHFLSQKFSSRSIMLFFAIIAAVSLICSAYALSCINDVLAMNKDNSIISVTVPKGAKTNQIIDILHDNGLINRPVFCKIFIKVMDYSNNYESGIFYLRGKMGIEGMLKSMKTVKTDQTATLTFPEGWTINQIIDKLSENKVCDKEILLDAFQNGQFDTQLVSKIDAGDNRYQKLEGYLFPDTYDFYIGENATSVLNKFLKNTEKKISAKDRQRAAKRNMSMDEVITLASIIQKEAANDDQMDTISSVLHNRLNNPVQYPTLDCDSTISFLNNGLKKYLAMQDTGHNLSYYTSFYNTYVCEGLPVGPICNPGLMAIKAALYPEQTDMFFFNHDKTGKMYTARTYAKHIQNVNKANAVNSAEDPVQ